jgi:hypothetical protein
MKPKSVLEQLANQYTLPGGSFYMDEQGTIQTVENIADLKKYLMIKGATQVIFVKSIDRFVESDSSGVADEVTSWASTHPKRKGYRWVLQTVATASSSVAPYIDFNKEGGGTVRLTFGSDGQPIYTILSCLMLLFSSITGYAQSARTSPLIDRTTHVLAWPSDLWTTNAAAIAAALPAGSLGTNQLNSQTYGLLNEATTAVVNLKSLGAVGDGVTDNTAVFQAAFANGGKFILPYGVYKTGYFYTYQDTVIEGVSSNLVQPVIQAITNVGALGMVRGLGKMEFKNIVFDGNSAASVVHTGPYAVWVHNQSTKLLMENCKVQNWISTNAIYGVYWIASPLGGYSEFTGCTFSNLYAHAGNAVGLKTSGVANGTENDNNTVNVQGCLFSNIRSRGNTTVGDATGAARGMIHDYSGDVSVRNSKFERIWSVAADTTTQIAEDGDCFQIAGSATSLESLLIQNCYFRFDKRAIKIQSGNPKSQAAIENCIFYGENDGTGAVLGSYATLSALGGMTTIRDSTIIGGNIAYGIVDYCPSTAFFGGLTVDNVRFLANTPETGPLFYGLSGRYLLTQEGAMPAGSKVNINRVSGTIGGNMLKTGINGNTTVSQCDVTTTAVTNPASMFILSGTSGQSFLSVVDSSFNGKATFVSGYAVNTNGHYNVSLVNNRFKNGRAIELASITRSGTTATATSIAAHGLANLSTNIIAGADQAEYNTNAVVTVTGGSTFTYTISADPGSDATLASGGKLTVRESTATVYAIDGRNAETFESISLVGNRLVDMDGGKLTSGGIKCATNETGNLLIRSGALFQ